MRVIKGTGRFGTIFIFVTMVLIEFLLLANFVPWGIWWVNILAGTIVWIIALCTATTWAIGRIWGWEECVEDDDLPDDENFI
jgi:hypothetical protein